MSKTDWYRNNRTFIEGELITDATSWLHSFDQGFDGYLYLDGRAHELKGTGKNQGKVAYQGSIQTAKSGAPYVTLTLIFQRASEPNEVYSGSFDVISQLWDEYKRSGDIRKSRPSTDTWHRLNLDTKAKHDSEAKVFAARKLLPRNEAEREAKKKAANVKRDLAKYDALSNDPQGNQAAYLVKKKLIDFVERGTVRYGTDKHGDFAAIQLVNADGKPVGVQRFYDKDIKGRGTNKDFTWGMTKGGAYHILGQIDKDYTGLFPICEGYADGVVAHSRKQVPVFVALDAGNLNVIAQIAKEQCPNAQVVIICDNDAHKYEKVDNGGVLKGVETAIKVECGYAIPDFSGYDQSSKPKDLWDLWQLGGDEAVDKLLESPQDAPENWQEFRLNYIGLPAFMKELARVAKYNYRLGNPRKAIEAILKFSKHHLDRLGIDDKALLDYVEDTKDNTLKSVIKMIVATYKNRLLTANQTVNIDRDLEGVKLDHKTMVIESGLGTGKTQWIKQNIFKNHDIDTVLGVLPRRVLAKHQATEMGASDYEDIKSASPKQLYEMDTRKITCVSNSLELLWTKLGFSSDEQFDCVVLDEIELNLHHLFSGSFESDNARVEAFKLLKEAVKNADYVICAQAQITQLTLDFLKVCGREDIHVIRNTAQRYGADRKDNDQNPLPPLPVDFFIQKEDCLNHLQELIESEKPVIVPCTSAKFARELALLLKKKYPDVPILQIDGQNCNEPSQTTLLSAPNANVKKWMVLIHSPVLEQGVSINEPHFKNVVGFCDAGEGICPPDSFTQMMFRSRHLDKTAVWVDPRIEHKPTDYKQYLAEELARFMVAADSVEDIGNGRHQVSFEVDDNVILAAKAKAAAQAAKNNTQGEVYAILDYMGSDINIIEGMDSDNDNLKESMKEAKVEQRVKYDGRVIAAPKITPSQYKEIKESNKATLDEHYMVERHRLERDMATDLYQLSDDEKAETLEVWNESKVTKPINALGEAVLSEKHAKAVTEYLLENRPQSSEAQGFWTRWVIRSGIFASLGGRFEKGRIEFEQGFKFRYEDLKGSWYKLACEHKDAVNGAGLGARISGTAPTDREIGYWISAMGISLSSTRVDVDKLDGQGCQENDSQVDQKSDPEVPCIIYKEKEGTSGSKSDQPANQPNKHGQSKPKRELVTVYNVNAKDTKPVEPKGDDVWRLIYDGIFAFLHIRFNDGVLECEPYFCFQFKDLIETRWYQWACANKDAVNKAGLGAKIKGDAPTDEVLRRWMRGFGIKLTSKRVDAHKLACKNPDENQGDKRHIGTRNLVRLYQVNSKAMKPLIDTLERRYKAGTMPWVKTAQDFLESKAQDQAYDEDAAELKRFGYDGGYAPVEQPKEPMPDVNTARWTIRLGILQSLRIRFDNSKPECDPNFMFRYEDLKDASWFEYACKHKDIVNKAGLGAQFSGDTPSRQVISKWISAMGIKLVSKRIDARQFVENKG